MKFESKRIEHDIVCADPIPSKKMLHDYYKNQYYQTSDVKKNSYETVYTEEELAHKRLDSQIILEAIEQNTSVLQGSLLELGCGEGFFLAEAREKNWSVTGVDFSDFGVSKWNPACLSDCSFGDIYEFIDEVINQGKQYDVCVLKNVLEHARDPKTLLLGLKSILKPTSLVVISVPNDYCKLQKLAMDKGHINREFWFSPPDHLHYFNTKNITPFVEQIGYQVADMFSSFPVDFFLFHSGSNYVADSSKGKEAHFARIAIDLLMAEEGIDKIYALYRAMAQCGVGRNFNVILRLPK